MKLGMEYIRKRSGKASDGNALAECLSLFLIVTAVWSITCAAKKIWPFGQNVLDIGDMMEQCVPVYTHFWDAIHGRKSLLFDWTTGFGNNMAGVVLHFGLISPFNIFFLFVKRSAIEASMAVYILIKLIAIGYSMRFLLKKWFPSLSGLMTVAVSLLYVFSVFNMQYYYAVMWLDVSFMFPLVMYGYFLLMNEKRSIPYTIFLAITCMMSFQHTYMLFLMLLLLTGLLPLFDKARYRHILAKLLGATVIALMLAAWILLPGSLQILQAGRLASNGGLIEIWDSVWIFYTAKWMKLLNLGIPLSIFLIYALKHFKQSDTGFFSSVIVLLCAPIVMESTNLLWHGGSYEGYTMRFAYMLTFWILVAGAYAYDKELPAIQITGKSRLTETIGIMSLFLLAVTVTAQYFLFKAVGPSVDKKKIPAVVIILIIGISVVAGCGLLCNKKERYEKFVLFLTLSSVVTLALNTIFVSGTKGNTFLSLLNEAAESVDGDNSNPLVRIKSLDVGLSHNYPLVMGKNAVSNYLAINSFRQMDEINRMGYAKVGYRLSDYGGTLLTDALLGTDEVIASNGDVNASLYQYEKSYGDYDVYRCLYGYERGIRIHNDSWESDESMDKPFAHQNQIAKEVLGHELLEITAARGSEISIQIDEESILYLYSEQEEAFETVTVTDLNTGDENILKLSESGWMNGILELGTWENASLKIQITSHEQIEELSCAVLPLQNFIAYKPDYYDDFTVNRVGNSLHISLEGAKEGDYLFLPLYHDSGWRCTVNERRTPLEEFVSYFILIPLQAESSKIVLSFMPTGLIPGIILTISGTLLLIIICKKPIVKEWETANGVLFVLDKAVFGILMLVFYIIPFLFLGWFAVRAVWGIISG